LRHKTAIGAVVVDLATEDAVRVAHRRTVGLDVEGAGVLVERMASPGAELLVAARADAVVPCLVVAMGGIWAEALDDAAVLPLPVSPERVEEAILGLRAAPVLLGARGAPDLDVPAAARVAAAVGELLLEQGLELLELNPLLVHDRSAVAVDAVAVGPPAER
jgi:acetyl-CoA synthetase